MIRLSVRALAELMQLPSYEQFRILHEQKYPKQQPNLFKVPYYAPALKGIRDYYSSSGNQSALTAANIAIGNLGNATRRTHNTRVLSAFKKSPVSSRSLIPSANPRRMITIGPTEIRPSWDLVANDGSLDRYILFNFRSVQIDQMLAQTTLELSHWIMGLCGASIPVSSMEYIDLSNSGQIFNFQRSRAATIKKAQQTLQVVQAVWPTI